jgi:hypothetical protein
MKPNVAPNARAIAPRLKLVPKEVDVLLILIDENEISPDPKSAGAGGL